MTWKLLPKKLRILELMQAHLEGINPANHDPASQVDPEDDTTTRPYALDLRKNVLIGVSVVGQNQKVPFLGILEPPVPTTLFQFAAEEGKLRKEPFQVLIQGFARDDKRQPTVPAYILAAQVIARLGRVIATNPRNGNPLYPSEYMLGDPKLIIGLRLGQEIVRPPTANVSPTAFFYLPVVVDMALDVTKPYVAVAT